jgi:putative acetyltransferase
MGTIIREVNEGDNARLAQIIKDVFEEYGAPKCGTVYSDPATNALYESFRVAASVLWVAEHEGETVGCCGIYPTEGLEAGCAELVKYYLSSKARGKGIGKGLLEKSIESARALGYNKLYLECLPNFTQAIAIYQQQGFVFINERMGNSGHSSCDVWMKKDL